MGLTKKLILVVDDKPHNLQFLGRLLSDKGYEVGMAQTGQEALHFVKIKDPDLILLDVMMPGMDGYEVCTRLKKDISVKHIPVIFITAKTDPDDIVKGFDTGGVDYVTKPFNSAELLARIKTHLELNVLKGLVPICSECKKIRDDEGFWKRVESYFEQRSQIVFSHGMCPDCLNNLYGEEDWFKKKK